jgi:hypothetical protein
MNRDIMIKPENCRSQIMATGERPNAPGAPPPLNVGDPGWDRDSLQDSEFKEPSGTLPNKYLVGVEQERGKSPPVFVFSSNPQDFNRAKVKI